ncbi:hypothetical protein [Poriferisphaera corsica]|nr:hypothetical protein [Poriferisphaera corsica]
MKVPNDTHGKSVKCPRCHTMQNVPAAASDEVPPKKKAAATKSNTDAVVKSESSVSEATPAVKKSKPEEKKVEVPEPVKAETKSKASKAKPAKKNKRKAKATANPPVSSDDTQEKQAKELPKAKSTPKRKSKITDKTVVEPTASEPLANNAKSSAPAIAIKDKQTQVKETAQSNPNPESSNEETVIHQPEQTEKAIDEPIVVKAKPEQSDIQSSSRTQITSPAKTKESPLETSAEGNSEQDNTEQADQEEQIAGKDNQILEPEVVETVASNQTDEQISSDVDQLDLFKGKKTNADLPVEDESTESEKIKSTKQPQDESDKLILRKTSTNAPRISITLDGSGKIDDTGDQPQSAGEVVTVSTINKPSSIAAPVNQVESDPNAAHLKQAMTAIQSVPIEPELASAETGPSSIANNLSQPKQSIQPAQQAISEPAEQAESKQDAVSAISMPAQNAIAKSSQSKPEEYFALWALSIFLRVMGFTMILGSIWLTNELTSSDTTLAATLFWFLLGLTGCASVYTLGEIAAVFRRKMLED